MNVNKCRVGEIYIRIHNDYIYRRNYGGNKILTRKDGGGTGTDCRNVLM